VASSPLSSLALVNCTIWLRSRTSSPIRFISRSSWATSTRMVLSLALGPRACCGRFRASSTSCGFTAPFSTSISPTCRGVSGFLLLHRFIHFAHLRCAPLDEDVANVRCGRRRIGALGFRRGGRRAGRSQVRFRLRLQQPRQARDQFLIVAFPLDARRFDASQHLPHRIHHGQQGGRDLRIQREQAVAQPRQQVFPYMGHGPQLVKRQKARGSFDGVNGAKHAGQDLRVAGIFFQRDQVAVEAIEVLVTLD
jgi:hypothetical protein